MSFIGLMSEINKRGRRFDAALNGVQSVRPPLSAEIRNTIAYSCDSSFNSILWILVMIYGFVLCGAAAGI